MRTLTCFFLLLSLALLTAQDPPEKRKQPSNQGGVLEWVDPKGPENIFLDSKNKVLVLAGNVHVRMGGITLRCTNLYAWGALPSRTKGDTKKKGKQDELDSARSIVREVYAEGMVIVSYGGNTYRCEWAYFDLTHERGLLIDATFRFPVRTPSGEQLLMVRAEEVRILARNRLQATDTRVTTSPFVNPAWHIQSDSIQIIRDRPGVVGEGEDAKEVVNTQFTAEGNALYLHDVPVFWFPDFGGDTASGALYRYIQNVRYRKSNQFGHEVEVILGDEIKDSKGGSWGNWSVMLDYLSKRGFGGGIDVEYKTELYEGRAIARYQRDHGSDNFYGDPSTKNRGRVTVWHRQRLPEEITLDLELNLFSDRGFYPTYYESDYKRDKPPENLAYLKKPWSNAMLSATASARFNDWLTRTEYQPELRFDLIREPLIDLFGSTLYVGTTTRLNHVRLKMDEALDVPDRSTLRVDVDTLAELPFLLGPVKFTPFAGIRYTYFQEDLFGNRNEDRIGYTFGATLSTQMWKTFEAEGGIFDLDGLRHVVMPEITFRNTVGIDLFPEDLVQYDDIDTYDNEQVTELRLRNLLQTIRHGTAHDFVDTFVDLETRIDYFPNADRDNGGETWGNLRNELLVRFGSTVQIAADAEYDFYGSGFEVFNTSVGFTPLPQLQAYTGYRHFEDTYDVIFFQANWRVEEKWLVSVETSYDLKEERGLDHSLTLIRVAQDWVLELSFKADIGENDYSIGVSFTPRLLFDPLLRPRALGGEPRFIFPEEWMGR